MYAQGAEAGSFLERLPRPVTSLGHLADHATPAHITPFPDLQSELVVGTLSGEPNVAFPEPAKADPELRDLTNDWMQLSAHEARQRARQIGHWRPALGGVPPYVRGGIFCRALDDSIEVWEEGIHVALGDKRLVRDMAKKHRAIFGQAGRSLAVPGDYVDHYGRLHSVRIADELEGLHPSSAREVDKLMRQLEVSVAILGQAHHATVAERFSRSKTRASFLLTALSREARAS